MSRSGPTWTIPFLFMKFLNNQKEDELLENEKIQLKDMEVRENVFLASIFLHGNTGGVLAYFPAQNELRDPSFQQHMNHLCNFLSLGRTSIFGETAWVQPEIQIYR